MCRRRGGTAGVVPFSSLAVCVAADFRHDLFRVPGAQFFPFIYFYFSLIITKRIE